MASRELRVKICSTPETSRMNAIVAPSGDQAGEPSYAVSVAIGVNR